MRLTQIMAANYNLDQKNSHAADAVSHDPEQLLADYARLQAEAQALRDEMRGILAKSLDGQSTPPSGIIKALCAFSKLSISAAGCAKPS